MKFHQFADGGKCITLEPADIKRITLHRSGRSWFAKFSGPEAERIKSLCGIDDICTAFLAAADPEEVHAKIAQLNPDYLVVINDL